MDEEATGAGELVTSLRYHLDHELFTGQVGARQLERLHDICIIEVDVDVGGSGFFPGFELIERLFDKIIQTTQSGCVVRL